MMIDYISLFSFFWLLTVSQCPTLTEPNAPLSLRLEGIKLGQRAIYRCPMGWILQGTANATCLASGEMKTQLTMKKMIKLSHLSFLFECSHST
jgi:hypothetical protein